MRFVAAAALLVSAARGVSAQDAQCMPHEWSVLYEKNMSPCDVVKALQQSFSGDPPPPLQFGAPQYPLPSFNEFPNISNVTCTTEMYNLVCACAACQQPSGTEIIWQKLSDWNTPCVNNGFLLNGETIKHYNASMPQWAHNIPPGGTFNLQTLLLTLATTTTFLNAPSPTPLLASSSTFIASISALPQAASSESEGGHLSGGAIAGIVIGGLFGLSLIVALIYACIRRQNLRNRQAPSAEFMGHRHIPLAQSDRDDEAPPAFTVGSFKDPIFEKGVAMNSLSNLQLSYSPIIPSASSHSTSVTSPLQHASIDQHFHNSPIDQHVRTSSRDHSDPISTSPGQYNTFEPAYRD